MIHLSIKSVVLVWDNMQLNVDSISLFRINVQSLNPLGKKNQMDIFRRQMLDDRVKKCNLTIVNRRLQ